MKAISAGTLFVGVILLRALAASQALGAEGTVSSGTAEGTAVQTKEPALTGDRHPLYRLRKSDVIDVRFTFAPEYDQVLTVQPDGFIGLKGAGNVVAEGQSLSELTRAIVQAYPFMHDPEITVTLKDFEKPFFVAAGQVGHPGKFELRSPTTLTEAVAIAGGFTEQSKHSQVVLFRKVHEGFVEARVLNVKGMLASRKLEEDIELKPGDMIYVPQNRISKIKKYLPVASLNTFFSPAQF